MFHHIDLRVLCQATEDKAKVREALTFLSGPNAEITEQVFSGTSKNTITMLSCKLMKPREFEAFFKRMKEAGVIPDIMSQLLDRFDEDLFLNLRFNKQEAYLQRFILATKDPHGGVIDVRCRVKAYPARFEVGLKAINAYLEGMM